MPEFDQTREELVSGRTDGEQARMAMYASTHRLQTLESERLALERQKSDNNEEYIRRRNELERKIATEKTTKAALSERYNGIKDRLAGIEKNFEVFTDPRRELEAHFPNNTPFLLFPLRMETRFKTIDNKAQLWVRVYPDECMVDSFEPLLSRKEVNNAARFWAEYYSAGTSPDPNNPDPKVVDLQKSAWALLVSTCSSGRAAWITRTLTPDTTKSVFPIRGDKTVILAIATENWDTAQQAAIFGLFSKLWLADGNQQLVSQIKQDFNTANPLLDADKIIDTYKPVNFDEQLPAGIKKKSDADLKIAVAVFANLGEVGGKEHGWSQATRVTILPERLALIRFKGGAAMEPVFGNIIPYPLPTSPDPSGTAEKQFEQTDEGDLVFAESIRWVADFDRAVSIGMGFRIDLAQDERNGFDRLMVMGVKIGSDAPTGKKQLEELFDHHYFSKKGFSLLPQGTPTNNTGSSGSGYTATENADATFDLYFNNKDGFTEETDAGVKRDGQWFADWLGIDYAVMKKVLHSDTLDQADARNMNTALWPATMGYVMESLMQGGFSGDALLHTRDHFNAYVSGRGAVPAIRIGNQPYGILPAVAFNRLQWINVIDDGAAGRVLNRTLFGFLRNLYEVLLKMENYWRANMLDKVPLIAKSVSNPYQQLLDIIGLHPNSVEFYRRYLESLIEMTNKMSIIQPGFYDNQDVVSAAIDLLHNDLGYPSDILPQVAALLGMPWQVPVKQLIDDQPLSEEKDIRDYTADKKNYIEALIAQANKGENAVRTGEGLAERPVAELYRLLKYALELGYHKSAVDVAEEKNVFTPQKIATMRTEQAFTHQVFRQEVTESRYAVLYDTIPAISATQTVSDFIRDSLFEAEPPFYSRYLAAQIKALERLKNAPTARLERAFVEHLDACSYRLDAWKSSLVSFELSSMRNIHPGSSPKNRNTGIFIGAFGWLENVRPEKDKVLTPKQIPEDLKDDFNRNGQKLFVTDAANEGYIHAPSLNQGVTAAVLRNGYVSHGKPDANNVLAVDLSSERIRLALSVIEGIQGGQSLPALLGYHFERTLHNRSDLTARKIDAFIYAVRKQFPLNADQLKETQVKNNTDPSVDPETVPITAIEARNVVHGVNLVNHVKKQTLPANKNYPFGLPLPDADPVIATAINETVNQLIEIADSVADLGMAESVHHVVMGNYDRAAGVLESYTKGNYPQEPDVIRTPRSGPTLTHRVAVPFTYVAANTGASPRAQSEPSVNHWLGGILPPLDNIVCQCTYIRRSNGSTVPLEVSLKQVGLDPIDLVYMLNAADMQALNELDDRLMIFIESLGDVKIDGDMVFNYTQRPAGAGKFSVFEVMPLVNSLRALVTECASLSPGDIAMPNEANKNDLPAPELPAQRTNALLGDLKADLASVTNAGGIVSDLRGLPDRLTATAPQLEAIRQQADATMTRFAAFLLTLGSYGIPQTGLGSIYTTRQQWCMALKDKVQSVAGRWQRKSDDYDTLAVIPAPTENELLDMERLISTSTTAGITLPAVQAKKALFDAEFNKIKAILSTSYASVFALVAAIRLVNPAPFDTEPLDIAPESQQIVLFIYDLQARSKALMDDLEKKKIPAAEAIMSVLATLSIADQVKQIETAARLILGDQFKMFPRYILTADMQAEVSNSWNNKDVLLDYQLNTEGRLNPLEDWLHGMARVNEKMKHLENCVLLREAFALDENALALHPVQLPYKTEKYHWMAMPFPKDEVNLEEGNTLLYTAFVNNAAASPTEVCGLLAAEWTEIIPATEETTGITFHYDRPNCEAPQALLLVAPVRLSGNWQWNDLVDAVVDSFEAAKLRAIEPQHVEQTPFTSLLPAVIGAESLYPYSIVLDNRVHYLAQELVNDFNQPIH